MAKVTLNVEGMSCEHCVKAVINAASAVDGVNNVQVDLSAKTVLVEYEPERASIDKIKMEIEDQGYDVISYNE